ncbi:biotin--[acetyl-CoA-carboxylase] ligase [Gluconobacter frateurii]|uniref:biotin--[biotin carboxyl-carrier protein] ligase n=1 Tax=Gluconobacter frateurii NRIC 0228 TaxID=1307946 RepID=A0ABQ0QDQ6_9PROT|nr:biotin--[acetyl-CoA-carboxylase] ligase [Gluconobacter frateurii]GBR14743.1 biotin--acetyl-CoA-carboxylase ligase [Gluconobacter frateurii NRIC 0228]GLP90128.1 biotin--[acetyl-CoA-carboxylase] ligase [Gluconobacter frateurii]
MTWRFEFYETLGSTSDLLKEKAEAGAQEKLAIQAFAQTSGRGTRGRSWVDPGGNLAISLLFRPEKSTDFLAAIPFLTALSLYETARQFSSGEADFMLKWPNDLLLSERKMAGVLIEAGGSADHKWVVVGIGANLRQAPQIEGRKLSALSEVAVVPDPAVFGRSLTLQMDHWISIWEAQGFAPIREAWLERAHPVGRHLAVQRGETYISGSFSGLDEQGRLFLALPNGETIPVVTGDILLD